MQQTDVLIVGGGVIGLTTALFLAKRGLSVKVLDRGAFGAEASWAGAGIIPPGELNGVNSPIDQLRAMSSQMFPALSRELQEITGVDNGYRVCGGVEFLAEDEQFYVQDWQHEGIEVHHWDAQEFKNKLPGANRLREGSYFLPGMAQVRNPRHIQALVAACMVKRVHLRPKLGFAVFKAEDGEIQGVRLTNWETVSADRYLIAAGAWSGQLLHDLGIMVTIKPVRGQMVLFKLPKREFEPILIHGKRYLVPREDGYVLAGATEEPDAGFNTTPTEDGVRSLIRFAEGVYPSLESAEIETTWAGLRPGTIDGIPYLGRVPGYRNLFIAAGHFRAGIQLSTGTAQVMSEMLCSEVPSIPMASFVLDRPPNTSYAPTFRS